jgi:hypothetical protein
MTATPQPFFILSCAKDDYFIALLAPVGSKADDKILFYRNYGCTIIDDDGCIAVFFPICMDLALSALSLTCSFCIIVLFL